MTKNAKDRLWRGVLGWGPFALLCVLAASRWLVAERWPGTEATLASASAGCGAGALVVSVTVFLRSIVRKRAPDEGSSWLLDALGGLLLLGGPAMGMVLLPHGLDSSALMIALALTPVVAGVACVAVGEECESLAGHLWPGLAALMGILLVLPQPSLADPAADLAMGLAPIMTGVGAVLLGRKMKAEGRRGGPAGYGAARIVTALSAGALFLGVFALMRFGFAEVRASFSVPAAVLEGAMATLAVESARRLGAMRFSALYALVPLVVLLEGLALMRPALTVRTELGLVLLLLAGVVLMLRGGDARGAETVLLDLR